ncbi:MAG: hypothetical protein QM690_15415, partial [Sphingobium sp.]
GAAGAATFLTASRQCLAGPFSALDPMLRRLWYSNVPEGMPVWTQSTGMQVLILVPGLLGLAASLAAIRLDGRERRLLWTELLLVQAGAFAVSLFVMRAMGLSQVLALPATAWLFMRALGGAGHLSTPAGRVLLGFACFALTPVGAEIGATVLLSSSARTDQPEKDAYVCPGPAGMARLRGLPPSTLFAPLDLGPHILAFTPHSVIGTGHHRNVAGMASVLRGFTARPDEARRIIAATPARYVAVCVAENEMRKYARLYPASLAATLVRDRPPAWLVPIPFPIRRDVRIYRILPAGQAATKRSATPFMQ